MKLTTIGAFAAGVLLLTAVTLPVPADAAPHLCGGKRVTIMGTNDDDHLDGTRHADVIDGFDGNDFINGLDGNDTICGNYGADRLRGNAGNDVLYGGKDAIIEFDAESSKRLGDILRGGSGNDVIVPGFDPRHGFTPPAGDPHVDDLVTFDSAPGPVQVNLETGVTTGNGRDRLVVNGLVRLFTTRWADTVVGSSYGDEIRLLAGADKVSDGAGDDSLYGGDGRDTRLASGGGNDTCVSIEVNRAPCHV